MSKRKPVMGSDLKRNSDLVVDITHYGDVTLEACNALCLNPFAIKMLAESFLKSPPKYRRYGVRFKSHGLIFEVKPDSLGPSYCIPDMVNGGFIKK